jgi:hypothetical protein
MKCSVRFAIVFVAALSVVSFLPLYVERTMMHVMFANGGGGKIEWGWKICSLKRYWADYQYIRREQQPALWLTVNAVLALLYATAIALTINRILGHKPLRLKR